MEQDMAQKRGPSMAGADAQSAPQDTSPPPSDAPERSAGEPGVAQGGGEPAAPTAPAAVAEGGPEAVDRLAELEAALEAAKREAAEYWDKYLRVRAEMENFKKRVERAYADEARRYRKDLLLKLLSVLDNLERAVAYQDASGRAVDAASLLQGLRLTYQQFKELLASEGLSEVKALGEPFDPAKHEAVATEVAPDKPEGVIVDELQKGYQFEDELLRPARVKVATRG
jgi:molecular chaperone GrpE